jgi:hypothetical protein
VRHGEAWVRRLRATWALVGPRGSPLIGRLRGLANRCRGRHDFRPASYWLECPLSLDTSRWYRGLLAAGVTFGPDHMIRTAVLRALPSMRDQRRSGEVLRMLIHGQRHPEQDRGLRGRREAHWRTGHPPSDLMDGVPRPLLCTDNLEVLINEDVVWRRCCGPHTHRCSTSPPDRRYLPGRRPAPLPWPYSRSFH